MQRTVVELKQQNKKESLIKSLVQPELKISDIKQKEKLNNNELAHSLPAQIRTLIITESNSSENLQKEKLNKHVKRQKQNITRPAVKLGEIKQLVRTNSRSNSKKKHVVKFTFNSPQHKDLNNNKILVTQPPKIKKQGIITLIQPPSVIKASTMQNLNYNPQKLFKICEEDALDNIFLKSKESLIRGAKVVQVQDLNDSLNFWKESKSN